MLKMIRFAKRWSRVKKILESESELYLFYLPSFATNYWYSVVERDRYPLGLIGRVIAYLSWFFKKLLVSIRVKNNFLSKSELLFFADTENQVNTLNPVAARLNNLGLSLTAIGDGHKKLGVVDWIPRRDKFSGLVMGLCMALLKIRNLNSKLHTIDTRLSRESIDKYLRLYHHLFYFDYLVRSVNPKIVVVANDHKATVRCLMAVCRYCNVKVVYMQHGSVTSIFPPLEMDFAFLDGEKSQRVYSDCENNIPQYLRPKIIRTKIYFNGCKKMIKKNLFKKKNVVGVGLAKGDNSDSIIKLVDILLHQGYEVRVRAHPELKESDISYLRKHFVGADGFYLIKSGEQRLDDYLEEPFSLIAGDSSLLLDNALSGGVSIYYPFSDILLEHDYYGFVSSGVALELECLDDAPNLFKSIQDGCWAPNKNELRIWSSTYATKWQGREHELAAMHVNSLLKDN